MLDMKFIRENPDFVKEAVAKKKTNICRRTGGILYSTSKNAIDTDEPESAAPDLASTICLNTPPAFCPSRLSPAGIDLASAAEISEVPL